MTADNKPKAAPWVISPEEIVSKVDELSDEFSLTPPQLAAIIQTTEDQLKTMRETGDGPPFYKVGDGKKSPVRYPLGEFKNWRRGHTFKNTSQVRCSRFTGMGDFLSRAEMEDEFLVAMDAAGRQWELFESIKHQVDVVSVEWKPLGAVLQGFSDSAAARFAEREALEIGRVLSD